MAGPFPGMDPYLEAHWLDVHTKLVAYAADSLNALLPDDLIARTEERVGIEADEGNVPTVVSPDVALLETAGVRPSRRNYADGLVGQYRLVPVVEAEPVTERSVEIRESGTEELVTVIEFVSPSNKTGKGLKAFVAKREALLAGGVNVVEIDLTRGGDWRELLPRKPSPPMETAYRATTRLASDPVATYLKPFPLRQPLPTLPIPLRESEPLAELPLQPLVDQAYRNGRYARTIDYSRPPFPPLDPEDADWAEALLHAAGKR